MLAGVTVGNFAFWADSLLVAVLLSYGANSFKRVNQVHCDNQLPYLFQVPLALKSPTFAKKGWRSYLVESGEVPREAMLNKFSTGLPPSSKITKHIPATDRVQCLCTLPKLALACSQHTLVACAGPQQAQHGVHAIRRCGSGGGCCAHFGGSLSAPAHHKSGCSALLRHRW